MRKAFSPAFVEDRIRSKSWAQIYFLLPYTRGRNAFHCYRCFATPKNRNRNRTITEISRKVESVGLYFVCFQYCIGWWCKKFCAVNCDAENGFRFMQNCEIFSHLRKGKLQRLLIQNSAESFSIGVRVCLYEEGGMIFLCS